MGFRTVVMLNNDRHSEWSIDPELGKRISLAMNHTHNDPKDWLNDRASLDYGRVVECAHADTISLVKLERYTQFEPLSHTVYNYRGDTEGAIQYRLLQEAADKLGYKLVSK